MLCMRTGTLIAILTNHRHHQHHQHRRRHRRHRPTTTAHDPTAMAGAHQPEAKLKCPCGEARFCAKACQLKLWPKHKSRCKQLRDAASVAASGCAKATAASSGGASPSGAPSTSDLKGISKKPSLAAVKALFDEFGIEDSGKGSDDDISEEEEDEQQQADEAKTRANPGPALKTTGQPPTAAPAPTAAMKSPAAELSPTPPPPTATAAGPPVPTVAALPQSTLPESAEDVQKRRERVGKLREQWRKDKAAGKIAAKKQPTAPSLASASASASTAAPAPAPAATRPTSASASASSPATSPAPSPAPIAGGPSTPALRAFTPRVERSTDYFDMVELRPGYHGVIATRAILAGTLIWSEVALFTTEIGTMWTDPSFQVMKNEHH